MSPATVHLRWYAWRDFDPGTLYAMLRLRSAVFVVEQACVFHDMDGLDPQCAHLLAFEAASGEVVGCLRRVPAGVRRPHTPAPAAPGPALGRLAVAQRVRGTGLGRALMLEGIARCSQEHPEEAVFLSAQLRLQRFYESLGFEAVRAPYDEDGIAHIDMRRRGRA
jgi:ElaA protein